MITAGPHLAVSADPAVHRLRETDGQPLQASRETLLTLRLHEEMDVINLDAELEDAEASPRSFTKAAAKGREDPVSAQGRQPLLDAQRHVHRVARVVGWPLPVRYVDSLARRLPPGAGPASAPGPGTELELDRWSHLD